MTACGARFDGRVALVTGAGGNIGRAIAVELAGQGADLILADLPVADVGLRETLDACRSVGDGLKIERATFDVREPDEVVGAIDAAVDRLGVVSLLVNNAGYQGRFQNVLDYDLDDVRDVMDTNVVGVFTVLQAVARGMRDAGVAGAIVNVASMAHHGAPNMPAYSASKGAVVSLTRSAAKDLAAAGIRVNSVSPGFIGPGTMWDRQVAQQASTPSQYYADDPELVTRQMIDAVPLRRYGTVEEVARVVCFLLSDASSYMTGSDVEVAGGVA